MSKVSPRLFALVVCLPVVTAVFAACGDKPTGPSTTTTTTTTSTVSTTTTSTTTTTTAAPTSGTLILALSTSCAGVVQASGMDVFVNGVLVGVATQNAPLVLSLPFGTHRVRARDRNGFLPEFQVTLTVANPTLSLLITC